MCMWKYSNPFAFVVLTVLLALRRGKLTDKALFDLKVELVRKLLEQKFARATIRGIFYFIRNYVVFADPENDSKFDSKIDSITQKSRHMGIVDMLKEREAQKILEKGGKAGLKKGLEKGKTEEVRNLITRLALSDVQAADVAGVSVAFVKKVRVSLKKKK